MEEERIKKSANKVKNQIEHWFFKYYGESKFSFDGTELFLPFELLDNETRK
jgi:hypothetical protein